MCGGMATTHVFSYFVPCYFSLNAYTLLLKVKHVLTGDDGDDQSPKSADRYWYSYFTVEQLSRHLLWKLLMLSTTHTNPKTDFKKKKGSDDQYDSHAVELLKRERKTSWWHGKPVFVSPRQLIWTLNMHTTHRASYIISLLLFFFFLFLEHQIKKKFVVFFSCKKMEKTTKLEELPSENGLDCGERTEKANCRRIFVQPVYNAWTNDQIQLLKFLDFKFCLGLITVCRCESFYRITKWTSISAWKVKLFELQL